MFRYVSALVAMIAAAAVIGASPAAAGGPALMLERIVVVERHGVRAPTKPPESLAKYSAQAWPAWPVAPGELTAHGAANVQLMGAWLRAEYARKGLWPASGCPGAGDVYLWADGHDQRTRASGEAVLAGAFPGCGVTANHGPPGAADPLFDAASSGVCPIDPAAAQAAVLARVHGDLDHPDPSYQAAKATLSDILAPAPARPPCTDDQGLCFLNGGNTLSVKAGELRLQGPLATASSLTEDLLLEYAEGMPPETVGWGRAGSGAQIAAVMPLHNIETDLMRRTPYLASHNATLLARAVADAVDGRPALPQQGAAGSKLVLITGHDTNLSNLAGVLGVSWTLPGQPDDTPPGAALVFEVWRDPASGARYVKTALIYQTLEQLRAASPLTTDQPPGRIDIRLPACADGPGGVCTISQFRRSVETALPEACRGKSVTGE